MIQSRRLTLQVAQLTCVVLLAGARLSGQQEPSAEQLLWKTADLYRNASGYHLAATERTTTSSGDRSKTTRTRAVTARDSEGRARVEIDDGVSSGLAVFNGTEAWAYLPLWNQYARIPNWGQSGSGAGGVDFAAFVGRYMDRYGGIGERIVRATLLSPEMVGETPCRVVQAKYDPPPGMRDGSIERTFWISAVSGAVLRERSLAGMMQPGGETPVQVTQEIEFTEASVNAGISDSLFSFTPPEGAELVETFHPPAEDGRLAAPNFELSTLDGSTVSLLDLRGSVVLLDFWASWCGPCRYDMPFVDAIARERAADGVKVFGVNSEPPATARAYLDEMGFAIPALVDESTEVHQLFGVRVIPTFVVIDRQGRIVSVMAGTRTKQELEAALAEAGL